MSGFVAVVSRDEVARARGPACLARLSHAPFFEVDQAEAGAVWIGACGRAGSASVAGAQRGATGAEAGEPAGAPASAPVAAVCGDILNRGALRLELGLAPTGSDAALVAAAYARWGAGLFDRLEGAFALVVHDQTAAVTVAGVDPLGVRTLFRVRLGDDLLLATEVKAFAADARFAARLDEVGLASVLAFGQQYGTTTLFDGVVGLQEGTHLELRDGALHVERHWDPRRALGARLRGREYVDGLVMTIGRLGAEAFAADDVVLPLTGGLDSRLLAAAMPPSAAATAVTFGSGDDDDCVRARQIAAATGIGHRVVAFEPDYVARHALETVWLTEGRLNPVDNITGSLMPRLREARWFVSGISCMARGHNAMRARLVPDWSLVRASDPMLECWLWGFAARSSLAVDQIALAFGDRADQLIALAEHSYDEAVERTRGMPPLDRLDLYQVTERVRGYNCPGLNLASVWLEPRPLFLTRRWVEAVLAGDTLEGIDDLVRLKTIRRLDPRVAHVPWVLTRLSLPASEPFVRAARAASRLVPGGAGRLAAAGELEGRRRAADPISGGRPAAPRRAARALKHRVYRHGERRDEWLRSASKAYVEEILLSDRTADRGFVRPDALRRLVSEQATGHDHSSAIGQLLNLELWHRLFVDGDRPPEAVT